MSKEHSYNSKLRWIGNTGAGTKDYASYSRNYVVSAENKPELLCSSDLAFRGDDTRYNPEDLLVVSLSGCHMLSYLHLCAVSGVVVVEYNDNASGTMEQTTDGGGHFTEVTLNPEVVVAEQSMIEKANELHHQANELCFIAKSCNFPVHHKPNCTAKNA